jgi:hypothetical protein
VAAQFVAPQDGLSSVSKYVSPSGTPFVFTSSNYDARFGRSRVVQRDRSSLAVACTDSSSDLLFMWMSTSPLVKAC